MKKKSGAYSRRKGHSFEREIAIRLRSVFPKVRRHLENHEDDAAEGVDLMNTGPYGFQLKKLKNYAPINAIKQVKRKCVPVLVTAGDREEVMAVLPFSHFLALIDLWIKYPKHLESQWDKLDKDLADLLV